MFEKPLFMVEIAPECLRVLSNNIAPNIINKILVVITRPCKLEAIILFKLTPQKK